MGMKKASYCVLVNGYPIRDGLSAKSAELVYKIVCSMYTLYAPLLQEKGVDISKFNVVIGKSYSDDIFCG